MATPTLQRLSRGCALWVLTFSSRLLGRLDATVPELWSRESPMTMSSLREELLIDPKLATSTSH